MMLSYTEPHTLLELINTSHSISGESIRLHRNMIGQGHFIDSPNRKTVFKLYHCIHTAGALQSISVIKYLAQSGYPVVSIIPTTGGDMHVTVDTPDGACVGN